MNTMLLNHMVDVSTIPKLSEAGPKGPKYWFLILLGIILTSLICLDSYGASRLPGVDAANKLEAAGTLLKLIDTALFIWGARIFCVLFYNWPAFGVVTGHFSERSDALLF